MSMIEQQLKEIRNMANVLREEKRYAAEEIMLQAAGTIEDLSAKLQAANMERSDRYYGGGWIACEDRLPNEEGEYLVCVREKSNGKWIPPVFDRTFITMMRCDKDGIFTPPMPCTPTADGNYSAEVTAWQTIPEPYRP